MIMRTNPFLLRRPPQAGASLVEVLVAVVVMAIGLLGIAGMQMSALRSNQTAYQQTAATIIANAIVERMEANQAEAQALAYNLAVGAPGCAAPAAGGTLASSDLSSWIQQMQGVGMLGRQSCGGVNCAANGVCAITVQWQDDRSGLNANELLQLVIEARIWWN